MVTHTADLGLDGHFEYPTAGAQLTWLLERLPKWTKALHTDSKIDTSTEELLWSAMFKEEDEWITARDAAQAAGREASARTGPRLHPLGGADGLRSCDDVTTENLALQTLSTAAEPMLQKLLQDVCKAEMAL